MKLCVTLLAAFTVACSPQPQSENDRLMDEIERQVRLPAGASPLQQYARHYALDTQGKEGAGRGKVVGYYLLPFPDAPEGPDIGCSEMVNRNGQEIAVKVTCPPDVHRQDEVGAGNRRWYKSVADLPFINDGECEMVTVIYDPSQKKVEATICNVEA
jgi:hypothetical protein